MSAQTIVLVAIVAAVAVWGLWYGGRAFLVWRRLRGERIVTCPETGRPAAVRLDIASAITARTGDPLTLEACSRWSERGVCDQPCADEAGHPEHSLVTIVRQWASERQCVMCSKALSESPTGHHVALLDPGGATREWTSIAPESLPLALATCLPVCWNCHIAETFRRMHPELVTERNQSVVHITTADM